MKHFRFLTVTLLLLILPFFHSCSSGNGSTVSPGIQRVVPNRSVGKEPFHVVFTIYLRSGASYEGMKLLMYPYGTSADTLQEFDVYPGDGTMTVDFTYERSGSFIATFQLVRNGSIVDDDYYIIHVSEDRLPVIKSVWANSYWGLAPFTLELRLYGEDPDYAGRCNNGIRRVEYHFSGRVTADVVREFDYLNDSGCEDILSAEFTYHLPGIYHPFLKVWGDGEGAVQYELPAVVVSSDIPGLTSTSVYSLVFGGYTYSVSVSENVIVLSRGKGGALLLENEGDYYVPVTIVNNYGNVRDALLYGNFLVVADGDKGLFVRNMVERTDVRCESPGTFGGSFHRVGVVEYGAEKLLFFSGMRNGVLGFGIVRLSPLANGAYDEFCNSFRWIDLNYNVSDFEEGNGYLFVGGEDYGLRIFRIDDIFNGYTSPLTEITSSGGQPLLPTGMALKLPDVVHQNLDFVKKILYDGYTTKEICVASLDRYPDPISPGVVLTDNWGRVVTDYTLEKNNVMVNTCDEPYGWHVTYTAGYDLIFGEKGVGLGNLIFSSDVSESVLANYECLFGGDQAESCVFPDTYNAFYMKDVGLTGDVAVIADSRYGVYFYDVAKDSFPLLLGRCNLFGETLDGDECSSKDDTYVDESSRVFAEGNNVYVAMGEAGVAVWSIYGDTVTLDTDGTVILGDIGGFFNGKNGRYIFAYGQAGEVYGFYITGGEIRFSHYMFESMYRSGGVLYYRKIVGGYFDDQYLAVAFESDTGVDVEIFRILPDRLQLYRSIHLGDVGPMFLLDDTLFFFMGSGLYRWNFVGSPYYDSVPVLVVNGDASEVQINDTGSLLFVRSGEDIYLFSYMNGTWVNILDQIQVADEVRYSSRFLLYGDDLVFYNPVDGVIGIFSSRDLKVRWSFFINEVCDSRITDLAVMEGDKLVALGDTEESVVFQLGENPGFLGVYDISGEYARGVEEGLVVEKNGTFSLYR